MTKNVIANLGSKTTWLSDCFRCLNSSLRLRYEFWSSYLMIKRFHYFGLLNLQILIALSTSLTASAQSQDACSPAVVDQALVSAGVSNSCNVLGDYLDGQAMIAAAVKFCQKARSNDKEKAQALLQCLRLQANANFIFLKSQQANGKFFCSR